MFFALKTGLDQTGLAQNLDMVRQRRFGNMFDFEAGAIFLAGAGQTLNDLHADRIAERGADGGQVHFGNRRES